MLLVVDNGSTDGTAEVLREFSQYLPLRVVREQRPGVSHARNAALDNARGKWLLATDDDVTVSSAWMTNHLRAFARYPQAAFVGGDIFPVFPGASPQWRQAAMDVAASAFAAFPVGPADVRVEAGSHARLVPYGANLAFSRERMCGLRFRAGLGRQPGNVLLGGEETQFVNEMLLAGEHGWLVAGNPVLHWIEADRQTNAYIERYYHGQGLQSGTREMAGPPAQRLRYMAKMRALQAAWPLVAQFGSELTAMRLRRKLSLFRGAVDGRRTSADVKTIGHGVAGIAEADKASPG